MNFAISLDGHDGSGKTTAAKALAKNLDNLLDMPVKYQKFPTEYPDEGTVEEQVTYYLNDFRNWFANEHEDNVFYIFDRSFMSTLAYQGVDHDTQELNKHFRHIAQEGLRLWSENFDAAPFFNLTCETEEALRRMGGRDGETTDDLTEVIAREGGDLGKRISDLAKASRLITDEMYDFAWSDGDWQDNGYEGPWMRSCAFMTLETDGSQEELDRGLLAMACILIKRVRDV